MLKEIIVIVSYILIVYGLIERGQPELANGVIAGMCLSFLGYVIVKGDSLEV
jgi:hypothetical protein